MTQQDLFADDRYTPPVRFDKNESERLKAEGMERAADSSSDLLTVARSIAREIAEARGTVTADDVAAELDRRGLGQLGNAAGSLFKTRNFEWTGEWQKSARVQAHSNLLRVWRLKDGTA